MKLGEEKKKKKPRIYQRRQSLSLQIPSLGQLFPSEVILVAGTDDAMDAPENPGVLGWRQLGVADSWLGLG